MTERFLRRHKLNLGFVDRLLLFRLPTWQPIAQIGNAELMGARRIARQFVLVVCVFILLYVLSGYIAINAV